MANIRPALREELPAIIALGRLMHAESWQRFEPYAPDRLHGTLTDILNHGFLWVHEIGGEIDGAMAGFVAECWYADVKIAGELGIYVRPSANGGIAAMRLIKQFIAWATERGAAEITLGITTGINIAETGRIYERLGFEHVGGNYKMRVETNVHRT